MTYNPDRNYRGVNRISLADLQIIHTAITDAVQGLIDAQFALLDIQHGLNQPQDWLKKRAVRSLLEDLDARETALAKALRGDDGLETEIGVVSLMSETEAQPSYFRVDVTAAIEAEADRLQVFADARNPKTAARNFARAVLKSLDQ